jgi:hypothetical protein
MYHRTATIGGLTAGATALLTEVKLTKIENVDLHAKRPGVKRIKVYYGPFTLQGANVITPH